MMKLGATACMMRSGKSVVTLAIASALLPLNASYAFELTPHRAVYDISYDGARPESKIVTAAGRWVLELKGGSCTGYNVAYRFVTKLTQEGGRSILLDTRGDSFESGDGTAFDFTNSTYQDNQLRENVKGIASRRADGVDVKLTKPEASDVQLDKAVLFPAQHFAKLVEDAKAGKKFVDNQVYEGVEGGKQAMNASGVILPELEVEAGENLAYQVLEDEKLRRWPVSVSYYKQNIEGDGQPDWQNSFLLYENGVARRFRFDYGDFALKATLNSLEILPKEEC